MTGRTVRGTAQWTRSGRRRLLRCDQIRSDAGCADTLDGRRRLRHDDGWPGRAKHEDVRAKGGLGARDRDGTVIVFVGPDRPGWVVGEGVIAKRVVIGTRFGPGRVAVDVDQLPVLGADGVFPSGQMEQRAQVGRHDEENEREGPKRASVGRRARGLGASGLADGHHGALILRPRQRFCRAIQPQPSGPSLRPDRATLPTRIFWVLIATAYGSAEI